MNKKTALVTGAGGFNGWHMVKLLLEKDYNVITTDINELYDPLYQNTEFIKVALTQKVQTNNPEFLDILRRVDYIFHIAGLFKYSASAYDLYNINVSGTRNLFEAITLSKNQPRVIIWGAGGIFGSFDHIPLPATEDMPPKTDNSYLLSKLEQERVALYEGSLRSIPVTVIRLSGIYGPRANYGVALSIINVLKTKLAFVIGDGKNKASLVHVTDVVRAAEFLAQKKEAINEIYHVTDDTLYSTEEMTKHLAHICEAKFIPIKIPLSIARHISVLAKIDRDLIHIATVNAWFSNEKIKKLGFQFQYPDSKVGIKETVEWYKAQK